MYLLKYLLPIFFSSFLFVSGIDGAEKQTILSFEKTPDFTPDVFIEHVFSSDMPFDFPQRSRERQPVVQFVKYRHGSQEYSIQSFSSAKQIATAISCKTINQHIISSTVLLI
jgi:hypothetical protein